MWLSPQKKPPQSNETRERTGQKWCHDRNLAHDVICTPKITILIADDHEIVRDGLAFILGEWTNITVVAKAKSGLEAVELWEEHRPDITLMDLQMPGLDGLEAARQNSSRK